VTVFQKNQLVQPFLEINDLTESLKDDSGFIKACLKLKDINDSLDKSQSASDSCFDAETQLTTFLVTLNFLALYKMVSIKSIAYDEVRNSPPRYLHNYAVLGIDSKSNMNSAKINYAYSPINTDAILLYKGEYHESVNLFPFIVDINALTFEEGVKICFYASRDFNDGSLNYTSLENNQPVNVTFKNTLKSCNDINQLMMDKSKCIDLKLDTVKTLFQKAENTILDLPDTDETADS
jgi:hypothetical protein